MSSFTGLLNNAVLLLALGVIYDALGLYKIRRPILRDGLSGLLVGLVGIAVMLTPWWLTPGIFFDTRWILISLCALFFGVVPTLIAVAMTVAFRLSQGGAGAFVGSLVIVVSAVVGLAWRQQAQQRSWRLSWGNLYLFGLLVQLSFLACMFLMPVAVRFKILAAVAPPVLLIYPVGTMLLGLVLRRQRDRREAEVSLEEHRQLLNRERGLLRGLINSLPDIIYVKDTEGHYLACNEAFAQRVGRTEPDIIGKTDHDLFDRDTAKRLRQQDRRVLAEGGHFMEDEWVSLPDGRRRMLNHLKVQFHGLDGTLYGIAGISRDTTDRREAEEERGRLQAQLAQAQRIESVGQLAGGIAHDFNNMLAVILGQAELAQLRLDDKSRLKEAIVGIQNAAKRSAELTQQLLAFARKQAIAPQVINLNDSLAGMVKMLRRLIGESIELRLQPGKELWNVKMDPGQLDQVLANLCVNSRDAIEGHGQVIIATSNLTFDQTRGMAPGELAPGDYVVLSVSDNGRGMDGDTLRQIFDPFFTTKKLGEGTGLGLATVYGVVKQNKGTIEVSSEPGQGTVFRIYLPRTWERPDAKERRGAVTLPHGTETILLVEDEESVLEMTRDMLEGLGYRVLAASGSRRALQLADHCDGTIELLMTDVIMPEINGLELSQALQTRFPGLKVLYMSGYTADVIAQHGVLDRGVRFIEKPFQLEALSRKVREALAQPAGPRAEPPERNLSPLALDSSRKH